MKEQENKDVNPHRGETLSSFLEEKGSYEKVSLAAIKNVLAWAIQEEMQKQKLTKMAMAEKMKTSRPQLDRLLDPENTGVTLHTIYKAAEVLGKKIKLELV